MLERYVIHVTKACNMDCFYCYEQDKTSKYTKEEVLGTVEKIAANCKDKEFGVEFLGGEPMLAFDIIKAVYEYLEENYKGRVRDYVITTNGTILTDDMLAYLQENPKIVYAVSLDGTKWANQLRRFKGGAGAFEPVVANLKKAINGLSDEQISVHMVTHPFNVGNIFNSIKFIHSMGVKYIGVGTVESTMLIDAMYCERFVQEMDKVSQAIVSGELAGVEIDILNTVKPVDDVRTYIKDDTGKVIGESYGRSKDDITYTNEFNSVRTASPIGDVIVSLRRCVYENHQYRLGGNNDKIA